jgi:hypothetical protein
MEVHERMFLFFVGKTNVTLKYKSPFFGNRASKDGVTLEWI